VPLDSICPERCVLAEFIPNEVNRLMYITYKFAGLKESQKIGEKIIFENDLTRI